MSETQVAHSSRSYKDIASESKWLRQQNRELQMALEHMTVMFDRSDRTATRLGWLAIVQLALLISAWVA